MPGKKEMHKGRSPIAKTYRNGGDVTGDGKIYSTR